MQEKLEKGKIPNINQKPRLILEVLAEKKPQILLGEKLLGAALNGDYTKVKLALDAGADIESKNVFEDTALILAAAEGHTQICALLLDKGADIEATDNVGYTALMYAASNGRIQTCAFLLAKGARTDIHTRDETTLLGHAESHNETKTFLQSIVNIQERMGEGAYNKFISAFGECISPFSL